MYTEWMNPDDPKASARSLDRMSGDFQFTCPVVHFAAAFTNRDHAKNVYMYHFQHRTVNSPWPMWSGVMHGDEIAYVFGDPFRRVGAVNYTDKERMLSVDIMTYWSNFAKTGDPNKFLNGSWVPSLRGVYWPVHSHTDREYLEIQTVRHNNKSAFKVKECQFWKSYLPQLIKDASAPVSAVSVERCSGCRCSTREWPQPCSSSTHSTLVLSTSLLTLLSTLLVGAIL